MLLRLTLDYSHFPFQGVAASEVHPLLAHARVLHARQATRGAIQTSLESGLIDFVDMVKAAGMRGFSGTFGLEYVAHPLLASHQVNVALESKKMRDLIGRIISDINS